MQNGKILFKNNTNSIPINIIRSSTSYKTATHINKLISEEWESKRKKARKNNLKLWNDVVHNLISWEFINNTLNLTLGETTYKDTVGTHENNPTNLIKVFGRGSLPNTLIVTTSVITIDNFLVFGKRSKGIIEPKRISTFGGSLNKVEVNVTTSNDIIKQLKQELKEELGLYENTINHIDFLGLAEDYNYYQQLHFQTFLSLSYRQLEKYFLLNGDNEHKELLSIQNTEENIHKFKGTMTRRNASGALLCHLLFLRN